MTLDEAIRYLREENWAFDIERDEVSDETSVCAEAMAAVELLLSEIPRLREQVSAAADEIKHAHGPPSVMRGKLAESRFGALFIASERVDREWFTGSAKDLEAPTPLVEAMEELHVLLDDMANSKHPVVLKGGKP